MYRCMMLMVLVLQGCHSCKARVLVKSWLYHVEAEVVLTREVPNEDSSQGNECQSPH